MSDHVNNDQQACFEGTAGMYESFSMDIGQPTIDEALDNIDWDQPSYEDLANVDWTTLHEEIMEEVFEDPAEGMQPGDRQYHGSVSRTLDVSMRPLAIPPTRSHVKATMCQEPGCNAGPFQRNAELNRHALKHNPPQRYNCRALDCERTGSRGFVRADKLVDHVLAGHEEDDMFSCATCEVRFERAEYMVHLIHWNTRHKDDSAASVARRYRTCPMPRCSFKTHVGDVWFPKPIENMDLLQQHLLEKHEVQARSHFAEPLGQRGYDARSCEISCPLCPFPCSFQKHGDFEDHFMQIHFQGPECEEHDGNSCEATCRYREAYQRLNKCTSVPDVIRQHRLAILRIMPVFAYHPVWEDIKRCERRT